GAVRAARVLLVALPQRELCVLRALPRHSRLAHRDDGEDGEGVRARTLADESRLTGVLRGARCRYRVLGQLEPRLDRPPTRALSRRPWHPRTRRRREAPARRPFWQGQPRSTHASS